MKRLALKVGRITAGIVLIILGLIGWLLPIVPGFPFIIAGLALLSLDIPAVRRLRERFLAFVRRKGWIRRK